MLDWRMRPHRRLGSVLDSGWSVAAVSGPSALRLGKLALLLLLVACRPPDRPAAEGAAGTASFRGQTLRIASFVNYLVPAVARAFEDQTGAKIQLESYESNEDLIARIESGAPLDVIFPSGYAVERMLLRDQLRPMSRPQVPNLVQVPERFRNPPADPGLRHCVPYTWAVTGLGVVSRRDLPGRDPDSLTALFPRDRPLAGDNPAPPQLVFADDMRAVLGTALRSMGLSASTRDPGELGRLRELMRREGPRVVDIVNDVGGTLKAGRAPLGLGWSADITETSTHDPQVRFVVPREGVLLFIDYACVPRRSAQPALAFAFLNHLLNPQIAAQVANVQFYVAPNQGSAPLLRMEARALGGILDTLLANRRFEVPTDVGPALPTYQEIWSELKAGVAARAAVQAAQAAAPPSQAPRRPHRGGGHR